MRSSGSPDVAPQGAYALPEPGWFDRKFGPAVAALVLVFIVLCAIGQAIHTDTFPLDEPLWFHRSRVLPSDTSNPDYMLWAIDVPAVNRWVYYAVLHATGLDEISEWEWPCWSMRDGRIFWYTWATPANWKERYGDNYNLEWWKRQNGEYAPRKAIMAMRFTNIAFFSLFLVLMWVSAVLILRSRIWAILAVLPLALVPTFLDDQGISFTTWSGDIFMVTAMAGCFVAWLWYHLAGEGTSIRAIIILGLTSGLAAGSKQTGVLLVGAVLAYLVWASRGRARFYRPLAALAVAAVAIIATNPVFVTNGIGALPWDVGLMVVRRRAEIVAGFMRSDGPTSFSGLCVGAFYWWPILPAVCAAIWACRKEKWFPPVAFWAAFLGFGAAGALIDMKMMQERYTAPVHMGFYFIVAVCTITAARRMNALVSAAPKGQASAPVAVEAPKSHGARQRAKR